MTIKEVMGMQQKVVVIGAGSVGATFAYALLQSGQAREIVLIDVNREKALGEVMDLQQGAAFTRPVNIRLGEYRDCADADAVVVTAGAKQKAGETRLELSGRNARILAAMIPDIVRNGMKGVLIITSNPVDVLTQLAWKLSGLPRGRVLGSGTVLDSSRLRSLLSSHCRVDARNIHAMIIGEHGDSEVAAWSAATIGGVKIDRYCQSCGLCPGAEQYPHLLDQVKNAAYEIISRKGATFYAVGLALVQIVAAVLRDEHRVLPVTQVQEEVYGVSEVALSLPAVVGTNGVERVLALELSNDEQEALTRSARLLKENFQQVWQAISSGQG
ncbi:L-lactate dehydrogenase [candidate division FCPU426 bacterium]|nr:L-lactate dehydrogenase [candidate division FCPU426 bacterium]